MPERNDLARVQLGPLAARDQRALVSAAELHAVRRATILFSPTATDAPEGSGKSFDRLFVEERKKGVLDVSVDPELALPRTRRATSTRTTR